MPLLHRKSFVPNAVPENLDAEDEVFFCPLTKEVFNNYEEFFERTILCNSLVWSCAITDRGNMTYQEAFEYEANARKKFEKFPAGLQKPMLILVNLMSRSRIEELNDAIFSYIKKRYFVGEKLEVKVKTSKFEECTVLDVISLKQENEESKVNGHQTNGGVSSDEDDDKPLAKFVKAKALDPNEVTYQVKISSYHDPIRIVPGSNLRRRIKREQCKIFLKMMCLQDPEANRVYTVKRDISEKLQIHSTSWEDIFAGPTPVFTGQSPKIKKTSEKLGERRAEKRALAKAKEVAVRAKQEKAKEEVMLQEMKKQEREMRMEIKRKEAEEAKRLKQIATEQRKKDYREKIEKMREVKRKLAEYKKEWSKQRDDLECDDLKEMPIGREIVTRMPPHLFGEMLSLLEFFHTFETLFDAKDEFPKGVSIGLLEKALMEENQDGPMCDILFFFLSNLFRTHTEEEGETLYTLEPGDTELAKSVEETPTMESLIASSTLTATWPERYQGCSINKLELDSYTVSEILRLYLLTSAARPPSDSRLWRFQQRGGYCTTDDTPLRMCLDRPELIHKLSKTSIFNFTPDEKLEILSCLLNHLLSYVTPRDFLDDMAEKYFAAMQDYREDKRSEKKREKDSLVDRIKWKNAQAIRNREIMLKHQENALKRDENNPNEDNVPDEDQDEMEDDRKVKLMSSEEQVEYLRTLDEEENLAKEAWLFRQSKHHDDIAQYQKFKVLPMGEDRFYRRYWTLNCIPGIMVEEYPDDHLTDDLLKIKVRQQGDVGVSHAFSPTRVPNNSTATPTEITPHHGSNVLNGTSSSPKKNCSVVLENLMNGQSESTKIDNSSSNDVTVNGCNSSYTTTSPADEEQKPSMTAGTQGKTHRWFVYTEKEEIDQLISSLNKRGFRESKLYESLHRAKEKIFSKLDKTKCPVNELCQTRKNRDVLAASTASKSAIELSLRDQILDLESRIFEGTLGGIKEEDGYVWVDRVTHGGTYEEELRNTLINSVNTSYENESDMMETDDSESQKIDASENELVCSPSVSFPIHSNENETTEEMEVANEMSSARCHKDVMRDLALALLQVERGIDRKYLKAPLGYSVDILRRKTRSKGPAEESEDEVQERKTESKKMLKRWESSLVNCTSISQISLHLTTLNKCIIWARSVLNASCRICHRRSDADKMLLCDSCDRGHHMYCLKPALKNVPSGDWFCPQCKPIHANRMTPRKVRTASFTQEASSEEEDTEADDESEEEEDDDEEVEEEEEDDDDDESSQEESEEEDEEPSPPKKGLKYKIPTKPSKTRTSSRGRKSKNTSPVATTSKSRGRSTGRSTENSKSNADGGRRGRSASDRRQNMKRNASVEEDTDQQGTSTNRRRSTGVWKDLNTCHELLKELIQHKDSWPFLMPVSKKQVPDYYDIIETPMDFSTMQNKFKNISYATSAEFIADMKLVFANCLTYNNARSVHAKAAVQLGNFFEKKMRDCGLDQYKEEVSPPSKRKKS